MDDLLIIYLLMQLRVCVEGQRLRACDVVDEDLPARKLLLQLSDLPFLVPIGNHQL